MRSRFVLLVVAILLVAGFAALNWSEIIRPAPLLFGPDVMDAPLGASQLGLLALALVAFVLSAAAMRTQTLVETRNHHKTLEAQRTLAEKAEASRFSELRTHLDGHLREMRERDAIAASEFDKAMVQSQREIRTQLEQMSRMLDARMNELEHRLETRFERMGLPSVPLTGEPVRHQVVPPATPMGERAEARMQEHAVARDAELRAEQAREENRVRDQQLARERAQREQKPSDGSGWRRWF
jgi:hypothetical protein